MIAIVGSMILAAAAIITAIIAVGEAKMNYYTVCSLMCYLVEKYDDKLDDDEALRKAVKSAMDIVRG